MNFDFNDEQKQLADTIRRWAEKNYHFETRKKIIHGERGYSADVWNDLCELGVLALPVPEAQGGFEGSAVDMLVVMQELGRALLVEPYLATVTGLEFLKRAKAHFDVQEQVTAGQSILAAALHERHARHDLTDVRSKAVKNSDGYLLNGEKTVVIHGVQAHHLIVSARLDDTQNERSDLVLFLVDATLPGVQRKDYRTIDGLRAADIRFDQVQLPAMALLGREDGGRALLEEVSDYAVTLLCAEAIGIMETTLQATLEYVKTRQQFGVPIGRFQVLQHRLADMFIELEQARSMAMLAAVKVSGASSEERRRIVSAAKVRIGQAARYVGQQAVQLHGGMGVTDELPVAHMFKRLSMIELSMGDSDHHLARFMAQPGFRAAA